MVFVEAAFSHGLAFFWNGADYSEIANDPFKAHRYGLMRRLDGEVVATTFAEFERCLDERFLEDFDKRIDFIERERSFPSLNEATRYIEGMRMFTAYVESRRRGEESIFKSLLRSRYRDVIASNSILEHLVANGIDSDEECKKLLHSTGADILMNAYEDIVG